MVIGAILRTSGAAHWGVGNVDAGCSSWTACQMEGKGVFLTILAFHIRG